VIIVNLDEIKLKVNNKNKNIVVDDPVLFDEAWTHYENTDPSFVGSFLDVEKCVGAFFVQDVKVSLDPNSCGSFTKDEYGLCKSMKAADAMFKDLKVFQKATEKLDYNTSLVYDADLRQYWKTLIGFNQGPRLLKNGRYLDANSLYTSLIYKKNILIPTTTELEEININDYNTAVKYIDKNPGIYLVDVQLLYYKKKAGKHPYSPIDESLIQYMQSSPGSLMGINSTFKLVSVEINVLRDLQDTYDGQFVLLRLRKFKDTTKINIDLGDIKGIENIVDYVKTHNCPTLKPKVKLNLVCDIPQLAQKPRGIQYRKEYIGNHTFLTHLKDKEVIKEVHNQIHISAVLMCHIDHIMRNIINQIGYENIYYSNVDSLVVDQSLVLPSSIKIGSGIGEFKEFLGDIIIEKQGQVCVCDHIDEKAYKSYKKSKDPDAMWKLKDSKIIEVTMGNVMKRFQSEIKTAYDYIERVSITKPLMEKYWGYLKKAFKMIKVTHTFTEAAFDFEYSGEDSDDLPFERLGKEPMLLTGIAGSSKTYRTTKMCEYMQQNNKKVLYLTYLKRIAEELKDKLSVYGVEARTIHSFGLRSIKKQTQMDVEDYNEMIRCVDLFDLYLDDYDFIIVDEAQTMEDNILYRNLIKVFIKHNVLFIGDPSQGYTRYNKQMISITDLGLKTYKNRLESHRLSTPLANRLYVATGVKVTPLNEDITYSYEPSIVEWYNKKENQQFMFRNVLRIMVTNKSHKQELINLGIPKNKITTLVKETGVNSEYTLIYKPCEVPITYGVQDAFFRVFNMFLRSTKGTIEFGG